VQVKSPQQQQAPHPMNKSPKAPSRATKASPLTTPSRVKVPTHMTKGGQPAECQVLLNSGSQCANPSRHPWDTKSAPKGGLPMGATLYSCTTHGKRLAAGQTLRWTKVEKPYDPSLWGGTLQAPKAPQQAPKAPSSPKAAKAAPKAPKAPTMTLQQALQAPKAAPLPAPKAIGPATPSGGPVA